MSEPARYRITSEQVQAIRRDGTIVRDLIIADWLQRSRPHAEYRGSAGTFAVRSTSGDLMPVGRADWVLKIGTRFVPCPAELFVELTQQVTAVPCGECRDHDPKDELFPAPSGHESCVDCLLELELSRQPVDHELGKDTRLLPGRS